MQVRGWQRHQAQDLRECVSASGRWNGATVPGKPDCAQGGRRCSLSGERIYFWQVGWTPRRKGERSS